MKQILTCLALCLTSACATKTAVTATGVPIGPRSGKSCLYYVFGIPTKGDSDIHSAAMAGGMRRISVVDTETTNWLFVVKKECTLVYGD